MWKVHTTKKSSTKKNINVITIIKNIAMNPNLLESLKKYYKMFNNLSINVWRKNKRKKYKTIIEKPYILVLIFQEYILAKKWKCNWNGQNVVRHPSTCPKSNRILSILVAFPFVFCSFSVYPLHRNLLFPFLWHLVSLSISYTIPLPIF